MDKKYVELVVQEVNRLLLGADVMATLENEFCMKVAWRPPQAQEYKYELEIKEQELSGRTLYSVADTIASRLIQQKDKAESSVTALDLASERVRASYNCRMSYSKLEQVKQNFNEFRVYLFRSGFDGALCFTVSVGRTEDMWGVADRIFKQATEKLTEAQSNVAELVDVDWGKDWKKVEFCDEVRLNGIERGRSAAHFSAYSEKSNSEYTIFMKDLLEMLVDGKVKEGGIISGIFSVVKRGANFGIRLKGTKSLKTPAFEAGHKRTIPRYLA